MKINSKSNLFYLIAYFLYLSNTFVCIFGLTGYIPELNKVGETCCTHTASWDDPFTLMCRNCLYYTISLGEDIDHYYYNNANTPTYEIKCYSSLSNKAMCVGKNNENGGRPYYSANCNETCIDEYKKNIDTNYIYFVLYNNTVIVGNNYNQTVTRHTNQQYGIEKYHIVSDI